MTSATRPEPAVLPARRGSLGPGRADLAATTRALIARIDDCFDTGRAAEAGPLLDRLRASDPLVLPAAVRQELLRCWARAVDERLPRLDVPAAAVDEDLVMLDALRAAAGLGPGPVPLLRLRRARLRGDQQEAAAAADQLRMHGAQDWEAAPPTGFAEPTRPAHRAIRPGERCRACELSEYGAWLAERRHHTAAARTLLAAASAGDCPEEPGRALARALLPLLRSGRRDDARAAYVASSAEREVPGDVLGLRLLFLARSGNAALGLLLLNSHRAVLAAEPRPDRRLTALTGAAVLLDTARMRGHGALAVGSPSGEQVSVTELARDCRLEAQRLANLFDRRHDVDHTARLTAELLNAERRGGRHRRSRSDGPGQSGTGVLMLAGAARPEPARAAPATGERLALGLGEPVLPSSPAALPAPAYRQPQVRPMAAAEVVAMLDRAEELLAVGHPEAAEIWEQAAEVVRRSPAAAGPDEFSRVDAGLGELAARAGAHAEAAELLGRAYRVRRACRGEVAAAGFAARHGAALIRSGRAVEGRTVLDRAIGRLSERHTSAGPQADPVDLVRALLQRALVRAGAAETALPTPVQIAPAELVDVRADLERAAVIAAEHRLPAEQALLCAARANLLHPAEPARAQQLLQEAEQLWIRLGHFWQPAGAAHWLGLCAEAQGRYREAAEAQERAQQLATRRPQPALRRRALFAQLRAVCADGRPEQAVPVGLAATVVLEEAGERAQAALARRLLGAALLDLGRVREAAGYLAAALPDLDEEEPELRAECRLDLAAALQEIGDLEGVVTHYGFASQELARAGETARAAEAAVRTGEALLGSGRPALAVRAHLHAAELLSSGGGADAADPAGAARARLAAAELLRDTGEVAAAAVALTRAWYEVGGAADGGDAEAGELRRRIEAALDGLNGAERSRR